MTEESPRNYWLVSGLYSFFEKGMNFVFGFGSMFILYRILPEAQMGVWVLFLAVCSFLEVSRMGLIQNALVKYLSSEPDTNHADISTASAWLNILLTIGFIIFLWSTASFFGKIWDADIVPLLQIYSLTTLLLTLMFQSNFTLQAHLDFRGIFLSSTVRQGLFFFFLLGLWLGNSSIELTKLAWFQAFTAVIGSGIAWYHARPFLHFGRAIQWTWVKKLLHFGKFAVSTNLSVMLYKYADQMMLGGLISTVSVAIYNLAIRITNLMDIPTSSAAAVVFPQSAREMTRNGKAGVKKMYEQSVAAILTILIPVIAIVELVPELLILIIAGENYLDAVPLLRITILFGLFLPFGVQTGIALESIGKPNINFYWMLFGLVLNIILNYLFIQWLGTIGAAYGTLLTYVISVAATQYVLYKMLNINTLNVFLYMAYFYRKGFLMIKKRMLATS